MITDVNCMVGHWPFRKINKSSFDDIRRIHDANGIAFGYISSINSIFYNDPFEGDEELHELIKDTSYKHILTINPLIPGYRDDILKGYQYYGICGVRVYPGYHGYDMKNGHFLDMLEILKELDLPLLISGRLEDERLNHITIPIPPSITDISNFLYTHVDLKVILVTFRAQEISRLKDIIAKRDNVFYDVSGLKDHLFSISKSLEEMGVNRMVYGSLYPLFSMKSTLLLGEKALIKSKDKHLILAGNSFNIFK